jgi:hypothetical protein
VYSRLIFIRVVAVIVFVVVFALYSLCVVCPVVCVVLCAVFRLSVVCYFVLCLIVVPLPPGKHPFAVKINNNKNNNNNHSNYIWRISQVINMAHKTLTSICRYLFIY